MPAGVHNPSTVQTKQQNKKQKTETAGLTPGVAAEPWVGGLNDGGVLAVRRAKLGQQAGAGVAGGAGVAVPRGADGVALQGRVGAQEVPAGWGGWGVCVWA
jgi:hypothetical protein